MNNKVIFTRSNEHYGLLLYPKFVIDKLNLNNNIFSKILIQFIKNNIFIFIIIFYIVHSIFYLFFYDIVFEDFSSYIFLIATVPSIYHYLSGNIVWNEFIFGSIIVCLITYYLNIYLHNYLSYFLLEILIIISSVFLMLLCGSYSMPALLYGFNSFNVIKKIKFKFVYQYCIYILLCFIVMEIIIFLYNHFIIQLSKYF
jgi:hypothetical protein